MYEIETEERIIGCLLSRGEAIEDVYGILSPEMFESGVYGRIYAEYRNAFENHKEPTISEIQQNLESQGFSDYEVEDAFKRALMSEGLGYQITGHATALVNHFKKRSVDTMLGRLELKDAEIDTQIDKLISDLDGLRGGKASKGHTVAEITKQFENDYFCDKEKKLILLGDDAIDNMTGGFQGGDIILLGARPGCGKSALAMQWAWQFAARGYKVGYYNLEMQESSVLERMLSTKTGIPTTRIRLAKAFLNDEETKYRRAVAELSKQESIVVFSGSKTVNEIRSDIRDYKFNVVIIDYLQLLSVGDRYKGNRVAEVGELSRSIKCMCMDADIPIIALSQLSRAPEGRSTREPQLSDLRESGSLEQDASVVFFLWDKSEDNKSEKGFKTAKSRSGVQGRHDLIFDGGRMTFRPENEITPFD